MGKGSEPVLCAISAREIKEVFVARVERGKWMRLSYKRLNSISLTLFLPRNQ